MVPNTMSLATACAAVLTIAAGPAAAIPGRSPMVPLGDRAQVVPGRYIVTVDPDNNSAVVRSRISSVATRFGGLARKELKLPIINAFAADLTDAELEDALNDPLVLHIQPVQKFRPTAYSWGVDRVNQRSRILDNNVKANNGTGLGVDVYVIDTGVQTDHPELAGRAFNLYTGFGFYTDDIGHGTHCSGTVAGSTTGVAPQARIYNAKVFANNNANSGNTDIIVGAINAVINHHNAKKGVSPMRPSVVSMSLGGVLDQALNNATLKLLANGILPVVAAGNDNQDACNLSPASTPGALTIGATDSSDRKASFSNYGKCVNMVAPGVNIKSSWPGSQYNTISGTSMATPHVSGAAAVVLSKYPTATPQQVRNLILASTTNGVVRGFSTDTPTGMLFI